MGHTEVRKDGLIPMQPQAGGRDKVLPWEPPVCPFPKELGLPANTRIARNVGVTGCRDSTWGRPPWSPGGWAALGGQSGLALAALQIDAKYTIYP